MSRDKNRKGKAPEPAEDGAAALAPPTHMNSPFLVARDKLQKLVPKKAPPPPPASPKGARRAAPETASKHAAAPAPVAPAPRQPSDAELFYQEMYGVRPLVRVAHPPPEPVDRPARPRPGEDAEVLAQLADLCDGNGPWDIADTDEYIEGVAPGIDRRLLLKLRRGEFALQGHVDLHGMTSEEAHVAVDRFVQASRVAGQRCVLIIHGRGINSKDQIPVLKERLRVWLARGRIARSVLAYATARPVDGGAGAIYALLRR